MARGINKVILVGNLGADPEVRYTPSGVPIANLTLATSESWKDKQTGETKEKTEWHRVVVFNRLAEIAAEYLKKGSMVYIEGALQTRKWQDQSGQDRYTTEVVVNIGGSLQILSSRSNRENDAMSPVAESSYQPTTATPKAKPLNTQKATMPNIDEPALDFDDDIPF